mgnify:CR=1 FL=1
MNPERAILSQILQKPDLLHTRDFRVEHFTDPQLRRVYKAMRSVVDEGLSLDSVTLGERLNDYVTPGDIYEAIPTTANFDYYYGKLIETYRKNRLRDLIRRAQAILEEKTTDETISTIEGELQAIISVSEQYSVIHAGEALSEFMDQVEQRYMAKGKLPGISTGMRMLDKVTLGFQPERYYVIGARPSQGKSALLLNIAKHSAMAGIPTGVISLESGRDEIMCRMMSDLTNIDSRNLFTGYLQKRDFDSLTTAAGEVYESGLWLYDEPNADLSTVLNQARYMVNKHGVQVIYIDYAQIIELPNNTLDERQKLVKVSKALKQLSRSLKIPIVANAQLNRASDGRRPTLGDFDGSSQFEKDADTAILIYHKTHDKRGSELPMDQRESFLLVEKNRDGQTGAIPVYFDKQHVRFYERTNEEAA